MKYFPRKYEDIFFLILSFIFSLILIAITAGLKIINPINTGWLSVGDGIMEMAWEFFRRQPLFQFPLGLNPKYGLEISSTMAFDGQIPLLSLIFHPLSDFLPQRFQYIGILIFFNFSLNFFFASKIFRLLQMNYLQVILNSSLLCLSPVILNRYIENTHYSFTAAWLLFWPIYLVLKNQNSIIQWGAVFNLSILIHFYYVVFCLTIYVFYFGYLYLIKKINFLKIALQSMIVLISCGINMYLVGFFYGNVSSTDFGYGLFKSTLLSLVDPSGWSKFIPDFKELDGAYEGFSYVGIGTLVLLFINVFLKILRKENVKIQEHSFKVLFYSALILFLYSLSNDIAFGTKELFQFPIPSFFEIFTGTFRSTGRYTWLLVFCLYIFFTYKLFLKLKTNTYSILIIFIFIITTLDISSQLVSEKTNKFDIKYKSSLNAKAWSELNECFTNIRVYPPVSAADGVYDFVSLANKEVMGINIPRLGRFDQDALNNTFAKVHYQFQTGTLDKDSFYIFSGSEFVNTDVVNYQKNLALKTIDDNTGWGQLDGFTFIAPNLKNCQKGNSLKSVIKNYGPDSKSVYRGDEIKFGLGQISDNYVLTAFSELFEWGVETQDVSSTITLNLDKNLDPEILNIKGRISNPTKKNNQVKIEVNSNQIGDCFFSSLISNCGIKINKNLLNTHILNIRIIPLKEETESEYPKLGLISLEIN